MEETLLDIIAALKAKGALTDAELASLFRRHNKAKAPVDRVSKKQILPYYRRIRETEPEHWAQWDVDADTERQLIACLQVKPRRTSSGVATITVITKPQKCGSACIYCPNDIRMPKSYLHNEPACQRAERNYFDPYLQVASRLKALTEMGHPTDKVELIVLGGTWCDYPESYQLWFASELFRALNDAQDEALLQVQVGERTLRYEDAGAAADPDIIAQRVTAVQERIDVGEWSYNEAFDAYYGSEDASAWFHETGSWQTADLATLESAHAANERAAHRVVGFVIETRPDTLTPERLKLLRKLGCTKIQLGIQTLDEGILRANGRTATAEDAMRAFELLRIFGFKSHAHFMINLYTATPASDIADYERFMSDAAFQPDELKLYPTALVGGTKLQQLYNEGRWQPYSEGELTEILARDLLATPSWTRISRMIRDISAQDILAGNKKTNLRQMVEERAQELAEREGTPIREIRYRELAGQDIDVDALRLDTIAYETTNTSERFLQWLTPEGRIAGFLRLSLPHADAVEALGKLSPVGLGEAMIREVHIYGRSQRLHTQGAGAQHLGLGKRLIAEAERIAREAGYEKLNVISSVGTREYYARLGFEEHDLYQQKAL